jgi:hypothetical protein
MILIGFEIRYRMYHGRRTNVFRKGVLKKLPIIRNYCSLSGGRMPWLRASSFDFLIDTFPWTLVPTTIILQAQRTWLTTAMVLRFHENKFKLRTLLGDCNDSHAYFVANKYWHPRGRGTLASKETPTVHFLRKSIQTGMMGVPSHPSLAASQRRWFESR